MHQACLRHCLLSPISWIFFHQVDGLTGKSLTYGSAFDVYRRFGSALAKEGFGKGDVLAVHLTNSSHYMTAVLGAIGRYHF